MSLPLLLTMGLTQVRHVLSLPSQLLCYLGAVVAVAALSGLGPAVLAAVAAALLADYYFIDPIYDVTPLNLNNAAFFVVAVTVGALVAWPGRPHKRATVTDVTAAVGETFQQAVSAQAWSAVYVDPCDDRYVRVIWAPGQDCQETMQQYADGIHALQQG